MKTARKYDPVLGRFTTADPMAEKYYGVSPYAYCLNNPLNMVDPDGKDGIYIAFPDYKISTPIGKIGGLGHAGILLINNSDGFTKYYEYGRYDVEGKGIVRTIAVPNVEIDKYGKPTIESLNKTLKVISEKAGHGGRIEGVYVDSDEFGKMNDYAQRKLQENSNLDRKEYSLIRNNCGTFAVDVLQQDEKLKNKIPLILDPRPNSIVKELQENFDKIEYIPK